MVLVIDYGAGNLASFTKALSHLSLPFVVSANPADIKNAPLAVLIGVGNFGSGMQELAKRGFDSAIRDYVGTQGGRLFGICVGMQLLFEGSDEAPDVPGLGLLPGWAHKLVSEPDARVPHVGFDAVHFDRPSSVMTGLADGTDFYFTHGFAVTSAPQGCWVGTCKHGSTSFVAAVDNGRVGGVQFHPEKSQSNGVTLLRNVLAPTQVLR